MATDAATKTVTDSGTTSLKFPEGRRMAHEPSGLWAQSFIQPISLSITVTTIT